MKKILYFVAALAATSFITTTGTSCKFAPDQHDGDTVAASEFYPIDTSAAHAKKMAKIAAIKNGKDSVGIYYVGSNSTKDLIELVSYPSRRDTMMYSKTRHIKVKGNADINHVVRVDFYLHNGKYNPQNEMFSHFGTKRYNFKNETQLFKVIPHTSKNQKKSTGFAGTKYI